MDSSVFRLRCLIFLRMEGMTMTKKGISNIELLKLTDAAGEMSYGANQEWYWTQWQQRSGCGPSTATNIFYYRLRKQRPDDPAYDMKKFKLFMEEMWSFVTPTRWGLPEARLFADRVKNYTATRHIKMDIRSMEIANTPASRPAIAEATALISSGLDADMPVAFLNLENEQEKGLDSWHWVTVVGLECGDDGSVKISFLDNGTLKECDFAHWWTTGYGSGGLVSLIPLE
jgi:hypothetical protein